MDPTAGDAAASDREAGTKPSGCIIRSDRSVIFSFGPHGDQLGALFGAGARSTDARVGRHVLTEMVADFAANSKDFDARWVDLGLLGLGQQLVTMQSVHPTSGGDTLLKVSIAPLLRSPGADDFSARGLLGLVPVPAFVLDGADRLVYFNDPTRDILRHGRPELIGRELSELFESDDERLDILLSGNNEARENGYHLAKITASGDSHARLFHKSSILVSGRQYVAVIAAEPIEASPSRSRPAERGMQLGRLVELVPAPVWIINSERRIVRLNEAARLLPLSTTSHLVGALVDTAYPNIATEVFGPPDADFASLDTAHQSAQIFSSPSEGHVFQVDRTPLSGPGRLASVMAVMLTDLSEAHGTRQELQMKSEVLEHRNAELDQFAHMASHDLRAPLRAIYAFTQMAMEEVGDERSEQLEAVLGSVDRMRSVLDSLLDYATANANPIFENVSLSEVVKSAMDDLASDIAESGAVVTVGDLPDIECDETSMRRLFQNLVANAIAYAGDDPASVTISSTPEYRFVEIVVTDRGIGFLQDQEHDVFRPFKRLSAESGGQGIGLSMCRRIVESHHGTIRAISQVGGPTSMVVRLPRQRTVWQ